MTKLKLHHESNITKLLHNYDMFRAIIVINCMKGRNINLT